MALITLTRVISIATFTQATNDFFNRNEIHIDSIGCFYIRLWTGNFSMLHHLLINNCPTVFVLLKSDEQRVCKGATRVADNVYFANVKYKHLNIELKPLNAPVINRAPSVSVIEPPPRQQLINDAYAAF